MGPLFDDEPADTKKRKRAAPQPEAAAALLRVEEHYKFRFAGRFGFTPRIQYGRDRRHIKDLLAAWGEADVMVLVDDFFDTTDVKVIRSDYSVAALFALAQHMRVNKVRTGAQADERTAANVDAARRAVQGKR